MYAERHRQLLHDLESHPNRILNLAQWALLNGISIATARRILKSGHGPAITKLSDRRIGISLGADAAWKQAQTL